MPALICPCGKVLEARHGGVAQQIICPDCGRIHLVQITKHSPEARLEAIASAVMGAIAGALAGIPVLFLVFLITFFSMPAEFANKVEGSAHFGLAFFGVVTTGAVLGGILGWRRRQGR